jgi:hypothetical protein
VSAGGGDGHIQALCAECHREKTNEQLQQRVFTESYLSDEVWAALVEGPPPHALVYCLHAAPAGNLHWVDRIGSRRNLLCKSRSDWPVFTPYDNIRPWDGEFDHDFYYVEDDWEWNPAEFLARLPMRGTGWYHRDTIIAGTSRGVLDVEKVTWCIRASCRISSERVGEAWSKIFAALPEAEQAHLSLKQRNLRKAAAVEAVGVMGRRSSYEYECTTSQTPQDEEVLAGGLTSYRRPVRDEFGVPLDGWWDFKSERPVTSRKTHYLWYRKVLDEEALQLCELLWSLPPSAKVYELNTDALLFSCPDYAGPPKGWRHEQTSEHRLSSTWKPPIVADPEPVLTPAWDELGYEQAIEHVLGGGSLHVSALAGTGKTYLLKLLAERLRAQGKRVVMLAKTHVAVQNMGGQAAGAETVDRFRYSYGRGSDKTRPHVVLVDELSLIDAYCWLALCETFHHLKTCGGSVVLAGDWFQLPPTHNTLHGQQMPGMERCAYLREVCGSKRLVLTERKRSCAELFNFYSSLTQSDADLKTMVAAARARFPEQDGACLINLTNSHVSREALNRDLQQVFKQPDARWLEVKVIRGTCKPQSMYIWKGIVLYCELRRASFRRKCEYTVVEHDARRVLFVDKAGGEHVLETGKVAEVMRLSFARTYHSAQGLEWDRVRLHDCDSKFFSRAHLIVGLSRCTSAGGVDVANLRDAQPVPPPVPQPPRVRPSELVCPFRFSPQGK